jgi:hypothetical protein
MVTHTPRCFRHTITYRNEWHVRAATRENGACQANRRETGIIMMHSRLFPNCWNYVMQTWTHGMFVFPIRFFIMKLGLAGF